MALSLPPEDYEDAIQLAGAMADGLDVIITRDPAGFAGASIAIRAPRDFLGQLPTHE